ncbi:hypothetical protein IFM89_025598 [Coptis chinensis]|uniref:Ubiquitin-like domain-containing protein n=1 Tax=Coptis chinensis TaxID=261450 RepID=A0A835IFJ0_9MAGN|nr:hypothetical protein IFM89_025598 [Coptis chinensis]
MDVDSFNDIKEDGRISIEVEEGGVERQRNAAILCLSLSMFMSLVSAMYIRVKREKTTYFLQCDPTETVLDIKHKLFGLIDKPVSDQRLVLVATAEVLDDAKTLADQKVENDAVVALTLRKGGRGKSLKYLDEQVSVLGASYKNRFGVGGGAQLLFFNMNGTEPKQTTCIAARWRSEVNAFDQSMMSPSTRRVGFKGIPLLLKKEEVVKLLAKKCEKWWRVDDWSLDISKFTARAEVEGVQLGKGGGVTSPAPEWNVLIQRDDHYGEEAEVSSVPVEEENGEQLNGTVAADMVSGTSLNCPPGCELNLNGLADVMEDSSPYLTSNSNLKLQSIDGSAEEHCPSFVPVSTPDAPLHIEGPSSKSNGQVDLQNSNRSRQNREGGHHYGNQPRTQFWFGSWSNQFFSATLFLRKGKSRRSANKLADELIEAEHRVRGLELVTQEGCNTGYGRDSDNNLLIGLSSCEREDDLVNWIRHIALPTAKGMGYLT